jgi:hypothetical protein
MFCTKCGSQNPDDADFCFKCGKPLIKAEEQDVSQGSTKVETVCTTPGTLKPQFQSAAALNKWVIAYGWLFIAAGLVLICIGITQKNTYRLVAHFFQTWLFCTTGVAILLRKKIAPALVWITVALSALGVLFRGVTPLEILLWSANLALAIWYSKQAKKGVAPELPLMTKSAPTWGVFAVTSGLTILALIGIMAFKLNSESPEHAREELARLNIQYDDKSFYTAAKHGDMVVVDLFLKAGMNLNTALRFAVPAAPVEIVRHLSNEGADPNWRDSDGSTVLYWAASNPRPEIVTILLERGADINAGGIVGTPLMKATLLGNTNVVRVLLDRGADANKITTPGITALNFALTSSGPAEIVQALLNKGAVVDVSDIKMAELIGRADMAKMLREAFARQSATRPTLNELLGTFKK